MTQTIVNSRVGGTSVSLKYVRVNGERLKSSLEKMAEIGGTAQGGAQRVALTDEDRQARDLFITWLNELDMEVLIDEMGNIFGKRAGRDEQLPPVMTGSHLDSQPRGGRFDGVLGVMGALEVLRTIHENAIQTERPIMVVNWTDEEGFRFPLSMGGSQVWAGTLEKDWAYSRTDIEGKRFEQELERIGYRGPAQCKKWPTHAYYEYHIEQGPILEQKGKTIGVPEGIVGIRWCDVYVEGKANQVGPTPMAGRRDALCTAAEMILKVNELPEKMGADLVATVGEIHNSPNSNCTIPDKVHFTVDIRSWDDRLVTRAWDDLKRDFGSISERRRCPIHLNETWRVDHAPFDEKLVKRVLETAEMLRYSSHCMISGAGHDAGYVSLVAPTAMIFVPSIDGRSHVELENTKWEDCEAGANVLLHCVLHSASEKE